MILGVDPGLANCGWALMDGDGLAARGVIVTSKHRGETGDAQRRLAELGAALYPQVHRADLVVVEWPSAGGFGPGTGNSASASQTNLAAGMIAGLAWGAGRKVRAPAPVTWRGALGHKRGKDELLHAELAARYVVDLAGLLKGQLPHVLDAIGLALFGELVTKPRASAQLALASTGAP